MPSAGEGENTIHMDIRQGQFCQWQGKDRPSPESENWRELFAENNEHDLAEVYF